MKKKLSGSITVRLSRRSLRLLRARARKRGQTASETLREIVEAQLDPWPQGVSAWDLTKQWVGSVHSDEIPDSADIRTAMEEWNPDRR